MCVASVHSIGAVLSLEAVFSANTAPRVGWNGYIVSGSVLVAVDEYIVVAVLATQCNLVESLSP